VGTGPALATPSPCLLTHRRTPSSRRTDSRHTAHTTGRQPVLCRFLMYSRRYRLWARSRPPGGTTTMPAP